MLSNGENSQDSSIVKKMKDFWELKSKSAIGVDTRKDAVSSNGPDEVISCAVKAVTIQKHTIHQIELFCTCCSSTFIVRAAHACERDNSEAGEEEETGLEWLNSTNGDQINLTI